MASYRQGSSSVGTCSAARSEQDHRKSMSAEVRAGDQMALRRVDGLNAYGMFAFYQRLSLLAAHGSTLHSITACQPAR